MAQIPPNSSDDGQKPDIESVRKLVAVINHHMLAILDDNDQMSKQKRFFSKLKIQTHEFFEFSEHSILSNLYWGIQSTNAAVANRKTCGLEDSEKMLQVPASLDENGVTLGIPNGYLICSSYFYLSVVEFLRGNEWQVAMHFLQAVLISPKLVYTEFAPGICKSFIPLFVRHKFEKSMPLNIDDFDDGMVDEAMRWIARRYKPWLMYYQIMSTSDLCTKVQRSRSIIESNGPYEKRNGLRTYSNPEKMQCHTFQKNIATQRKLVTQSSSVKCLRDILTESEPDSPVSLHSDSYSSSIEEIFPQEDYEEVHRAQVLDHHASLPWDRYTTLDSHNQHFNQKIFSTLMSNSVHDDNLFIEKIISKLCFADENSHEEDYTVEMNTIYQILNTKQGLKYSLLKDIILDQLLLAISTSKYDTVIRTAVSILSTIIVANPSVADDVKRKGLNLHDLATALKRDIHEAVTLIYLTNPSPSEIKKLELLPCLVEVISNSKVELSPLLLTPPSASLMIIEVLVDAFDYETNSMHLAMISSPNVLSRLLKVPRKDNVEEVVSMASVLVKCMKFDGKCRKYISEFSPISPFVTLLWSNHKRATSVALEFFTELLRMPRSSAVSLLEQMQKHGSINMMCALFRLLQSSEAEYKLLAANLLLQLEVLEDASAKCKYREAAAEALLESLKCEEFSHTQSVASFIVSNLGGTHSWTGEPYTMAWLVKKTGLILPHHKNLIKTYDFLDQCLMDGGVDSWCSKMGRRLLQLGTRVFDSLEKGLKSKSKRVARESLIATAWIGCEVMKGPEELRDAGCEILLHTVQQFVHPGFELEERLLACLCIYNYTSRRGMKKIINLSEGVRESLRRLSSVTWMAEELLKVADYFQPNNWRISCVHSQVLEAGNKYNGAVTALIYYKGLLHSGYSDGSIKAWEIKGQTATLVNETKEHKKAITCFALYEPGNCLLTGSADKTIKMWQLLQRNIECIELIPMKETVRSIDSSGEFIFATTQNHKLKVIDGSRKVRDLFTNKRVKCIKVLQGKVYAGCTDSSVQEMTIVNNRQQDIKAPSKSWIQNKPISSISVYKDWLYTTGLDLEASKIKDWRRTSRPQISVTADKGGSIVAMEVVEDFIYLNCSTSMSSLQIWLRGTQHKVGRLSAGSKITSLLAANDMILCGTEKGVIKGWIPL